MGITLTNSESTLSIDGNLVKDLSNISHTLGLNENTPEVETHWVVTSPDNVETVYTLRESATPTEYTQVEVLSPASGLSASIENETITVNYNDAVTAATAEIQLRSIGTPQLVSETIVLTLNGSSFEPIEVLTLSVATTGGTYSQEYSIELNYIPEYFSFSTGEDFNYTHPGPHVLAGYLTLHIAETGTGYILVKETEETAPNFDALKADAPNYQTYNLKKNRPQWSAIVNLDPETNYTIYIGIEYDGKNYMDSVSTKTMAVNNPDWGMLFEENTRLVRKVQVYKGQGMILPGVLNSITPSFLPEWIDVGNDNEVDITMTEGYYEAGNRVSNFEILGSGWSGFQYHMWVYEIPSGSSALDYGGDWEIRVADKNPSLLKYEIKIVE